MVAVSIFVNPTQFGDPADLAHYPRTFDADLAWPSRRPAASWSSPRRWRRCTRTRRAPRRPPCRSPALRGRWEGASRPGHFDGVATVVVKLLSAAGRCRAYFGEKDFQQLALVRRLVRDLALPARGGGVPDRPRPRRPGPVQP